MSCKKGLTIIGIQRGLRFVIPDLPPSFWCNPGGVDWYHGDAEVEVVIGVVVDESE